MLAEQLLKYWGLLLQAPPTLMATGSVLLLLFLVSFFFFFVPGVFLRVRLGRVLKRLSRGKSNNSSDLQKIFDSDPKLRSLWNEFRATLHEQKEERDGQIITVAVRSTALAELFFNERYVVDTRLRTEFFKHFPGIFTGVGIIGTFLGVISGLQSFKVSEDPAGVRQSLEFLLNGVFEAFLVSALAITVAMLVTFFEKLLLATLYRCTERIAQYLDSLFSAGAGEEYLSRLVTASEESASQTRILKDSLVGDLRVLLQELTDRQIEAQTRNSQELGRQIASGIEASLQEPLKEIGALVAKASGDQSNVAADLMKDAMTSFSQQLNELFGGQIAGIQDLNNKSAQAMQDAVTSLNQLVGRLEESSQKSGDTMAEKMANAVEQMEHRQAEITQQTQSLVESMKQTVENSHNETNTKLSEAVSMIGTQVTEMVTALQTQSALSMEKQHQREQHISDRTGEMITSLGGSVAQVVSEMAAATQQMQQSVASLERMTNSSMDKMNAGARTLELGATAFSNAGEKVTGALNQAATVADKMTEVSGSLTVSSSALQAVLADYKSNRDATTQLLTEVRAVVESAKHEASLTVDFMKGIETAASALAVAQQDTEQYLEDISEVLARAQGSFQDGLIKTLERSNTDFHNKLSTAVGLLSSSIEELDVSLTGAAGVRR
ncbi:anti-phage defense ZorAB system ZorA [Alcaligenaceae bacterium]|nr:anti-phage defense ZorAB system ZorA [Alcaligenaceae bacterium]